MTGTSAKNAAKAPKYIPDYTFEKAAQQAHGGRVAGVDEAGRGPLAGPVVAGAVILDENCIPDGLNDSKALSADRRNRLYEEIVVGHLWAVGIVQPPEIDEINILQATMKAMRLAVEGLGDLPGACLIDGNRCPDLACPTIAIVKGDSRSLSVAAASVIAKVSRDRIMIALDAQYPGYGWAKNMGYGTQQHREALATMGPTPEHRRSFAPVRAAFVKTMQMQQKGR